MSNLNKPARIKSPTPAAPPGQERPNENFRDEALTRTAIVPPDANAHIRDEAETRDRGSPAEKNRRNASAPKRGFERGDSRSQPDNYHPYAEESVPAAPRKT